jgi:hypothetical protein
MKRIAQALALTALAAGTASTANAAVTLHAGDNSLTDQIHLDTTFDNSDVATVHGITTSGIRILFTGNTNIDGTSGSGYAQINDSASAGDFNTLTITPDNALGFSDYEFSIMYDGGKKAGETIYLTIAYTLLGGGGGAFTYSGSSPFDALLYDNNANKDFRLAADGGDDNTSIILSGRFGTGVGDPLAPIVEQKQNDVVAVLRVPPAVPEPSTWAFMLAGFGAAGVAMRRSRRKMVSQLA